MKTIITMILLALSIASYSQQKYKKNGVLLKSKHYQRDIRFDTSKCNIIYTDTTRVYTRHNAVSAIQKIQGGYVIYKVVMKPKYWEQNVTIFAYLDEKKKPISKRYWVREIELINE